MVIIYDNSLQLKILEWKCYLNVAVRVIIYDKTVIRSFGKCFVLCELKKDEMIVDVLGFAIPAPHVLIPDGAWKGFMKAFFIKPFEAPQTRVEIKI